MAARLGDIIFDVVTNENVRDSLDITDHQVEDGSDISDHARKNSSILTITGVFVQEDAAEKLSQINNYMSNKKIVNYRHRNAMNNVLIQSIDRNHNADNAYGFAYDITLKQIRLTSAKRVEIKVAHPQTKKKDTKIETKVKKKTNKGKQQVKKKNIKAAEKVKITNKQKVYRKEKIYASH